MHLKDQWEKIYLTGIVSSVPPNKCHNPLMC